MERAQHYLRRVLMWLLGIVAAAVIVPFFATLARQLGLFDNPTGTVYGVVDWLLKAVRSPWFTYPAVFVSGGACVLWLDSWLRRPQRGFKHFTRATLIRDLRPYAHPNNNVRINIGSASQADMASKLARAFEKAGWAVNYDPVPKEPITHQIWSGAKIGGCNPTLLGAVRNAMLRAGIKVHTTVAATNKIERSRPAWARLDRRVWIRVGHSW